MRLKQCIFALVAMLLCAFSANAQVTTEAALNEALTTGGEVTLGADINVAAQIEIPAGKTVVLDLAGYEIVGGWNGSSTTNHIYVLSNRGTLTIKDSGTEGKIVSRGIYNYGELILESGTIDACDGNGGYAVNNESGSTFIMNGGVVSASYEDGDAPTTGNYDATALDVPAGCTATLNGGKITSVTNYTYAISLAGELIVPETSTVEVTGAHGAISISAGSADIAGGTFICSGVQGQTDNVVYVSGGSMDISGGTFEGDSDGASGGCCVCDLAGGATINGGSFSKSSGGDVCGTTGSTTINGGTFENLTETQHVAVGATITNAGKTYTKTENGTMEETTFVAKIGSTTYATFAETLTAASAMSGDVTIEVYDKVTLNTAFSGSYSSINFVGKDTDAEIYLDVQGYITATGKKVSFTDLTLSKSAGVYITNAGFMNVAFGIYDVTEVAYTNCVFANGAYASSGNVTFNDCTFYRSYDKYGLWAYGDVDVTVDGCKFDNDRGIKMYAEGAAKTTDLAVKNTDFSALTGKPAIVLTYGESVVLEGNTYSSTGTFELDLDGAPNGTAVTSDVAPTCKNDNGTCGVLVDGKIYTTAAQAAAVAAEGSNVTLLYSTTETVEFAEGVNLTLANGVTADNVTVATSAVAKIGETSYATLAEAIAAAESGATITLMNGEHELPAFSNKELTFVGESKDGVIVNDAPDARAQGWNGSTFHFENLTAKGATANYHGLANGVVALTYKNCNINGLRFLYANTVSFEDCAFKAEGVEHSFWTYGSSNVTVKNSTFTYTDRAVNCYSENGADHETDITFEGCSFTYAGTNDAPEGAVEINSGSSKSIDLAMNNCTAPEKGAMWFNSQWDSKNGENTVVSVDDVIVWQVPAVATVNGVEYKSLQAALDAAAAGTGNVTVTILADVNLTGIDWNPVTVSEPGYPLVTVEGGDHTITGLNDMLFHSTWAGKSGLIIKDLTIANSAIVNDKDDAAGTVGVGAFIGYPQASATITLENCHLENSSVEGGHWTGGLIGMAGGYNGEDGPVFMNLTIEGCSVTGSTITGKGSVGGVIGHGSCAAWTNVVIKETTVENNTITSTGSSNVKAGAVMGTIGAAGQPTTANDETKTGGASVSATVAGNTVTSNGTAITTIYGRQGTATGQLYVAGGSYDNYPIEQGVAYAAPVEGYVIVENADGTYGLEEKVELPEVEITDIKGSLTDSDPDLTFALNFTIKDLENLDEEYLAKVMEKYGSWYTDYVLTISGLTDENVTFNANGDSDGYLAGQYDGFGPNWVSVPFENVTLANNESIYIMEYAAKLMGQSGLRYTLAEIVSIVMDFDCGVYFTPEFLTANPGLKVDLHLKVFTEDAEGNKVNDINVATNNFDVEDYVAIVHATGKQTTYCTTLADAVAAAEADEKITLIADVELTETLNIPAGKEVVLDLNGKTISQTKEQTAGYQMILNDGKLTINDSSEAKTGKISYTDSGNGGEYISDVIYNRSVLVINGGTIENLSSATVASNGYPHAVDTYSGIRDTYVEINGGTIYCAEYSAIRMFCVSATNKADLVINGGTIKGAIDMQNGTKNLALGTLTINDGTFETTKNANNIRFANWNGGATEYGISAAIKGGSFNGGITTAYVPAAANWDKGVITGGTFAKDMTEYCAEGFVCEANIDGTYGIVADPSYIAELTIDDANPVDYTSDLEGKTVGKLTYKRSLIGGIWNPFFVPFEIDIERLVNEFGLEVAYYNQMISTENADGGFDYKMEVKHLTSGVISHYPLFVKVATDTEIEYVAEDVVLGSADEFVITTSSVTNTFKLYGTHQAKSVSDLEGKYAINALNGQWTPSTSGIKPHRLYFEIQENNNNPFSSSPAKSIGIVVRGEEGFTGIEEVTGEANENVIFDLQGRRILEPQKGELYIINGKKVIY